MAPKKKADAEADTVNRFELDGEVLEIDSASVTFREGAWLEPYIDKPLQEPWALATIAKHRKSPNRSLDEVMDSIGDIEIRKLTEAPKPKRPTKTPADSGTQD